MNDTNDMNNEDDHTNGLSHAAVSQALERLFVHDDRDEAFRQVPAWQVQRHLADCASCQRRFDAHALADRWLTSFEATEEKSALAGLGDLETSSFERSFGEASFLGALDQLLEEEQAEEEQAEEEQAPSSEDNLVDLDGARAGRSEHYRRFGMAAAVLLIGGASWFAFQQSQNSLVPSQDDAFQARSAATTDIDGPFATPEIEIFCAERTPDGVAFTGTKDAPFGLLTCPIDAEIKLAYKNTSPKLHYAAFFGIDQHGKIYWYGPTPAHIAAIRADQGSQMMPFGDAIRLEVNHEPGGVRVFGLFSPEPVDFLALERAVEDFDRRRLFDGVRPDQMAVHGVLTSGLFKVGNAEASDAEASDAEASDGGRR